MTACRFPGVNFDVPVPDGPAIPGQLVDGQVTTVWQMSTEEMQQFLHSGAIALVIRPIHGCAPVISLKVYEGAPQYLTSAEEPLKSEWLN